MKRIFISYKRAGQGYLERGMIFCHKCGAQKVDVHAGESGRLIGRCPVCEPIEKPSARIESQFAMLSW